MTRCQVRCERVYLNRIGAGGRKEGISNVILTLPGAIQALHWTQGRTNARHKPEPRGPQGAERRGPGQPEMRCKLCTDERQRQGAAVGVGLVGGVSLGGEVW